MIRPKRLYTTIDDALEMARRGLVVGHFSAHGMTKIRPVGGLLEVTTEPHKIRGMEITSVFYDEYDG